MAEIYCYCTGWPVKHGRQFLQSTKKTWPCLTGHPVEGQEYWLEKIIQRILDYLTWGSWSNFALRSSFIFPAACNFALRSFLFLSAGFYLHLNNSLWYKFQFINIIQGYIFPRKYRKNVLFFIIKKIFKLFFFSSIIYFFNKTSKTIFSIPKNPRNGT